MTNTQSDFPYLRQNTIGILGGGQLGRMLALAAGRLGFNTIILDPNENCPASQFANTQIVAGFEDNAALQKLANACHIVTYEFENIPVASVKFIEQHSEIQPGSNALKISQDRLVEKNFITAIPLKVAPFASVTSRDELDAAISRISLPAILKTRRLGYDGKGQLKLTPTTINKNTDEIASLLNSECVLEELIAFDCEISVIAARSRDGEIRCYDPARNTHKDGMLVTSTLPCGLSEGIINEAKRQTGLLMEKLNYVGVIGVEFFVTTAGRLLINEFAPRVHNSGHWTEAVCITSQFEQHIRAITNLPLGTTRRHADCTMENLIGDEIFTTPSLAAQPDSLINNYGKSESKPGRKMGHVTRVRF